MCGRFALATTPEELAKFFGIPDPEIFHSRYNIAPTSPISIVRIGQTKRRELAHVSWGLVPSWVKRKDQMHPMINARGETVADKPSFRSAFKRRRCLVPASAFYEWSVKSGSKRPYVFYQERFKLFALAGIWDHVNLEDGTEIESCAIITKDSGSKMLPYHERMPVVIMPDKFEEWLTTDEQESKNLLELIRNYTGNEMQCHPVTREMNRPEHDTPDCIVEVEE